MAYRIFGTNSALCTWILASLIDACLIIWAFVIAFTFRSRWNWFVSGQATLYVRWSNIVWWTRANWLMVNGITNRIHSARIQTRITTFLVETASIRRTIIVCDTLRIRTNSGAINDTTEAIDIAWIRHTWIGWFIQNRSAFNKWITKRLAWARTYRTVIYRFACRSISTNIWTWINTLVVHTRFGSWTIWANHTFWLTTSFPWITEIAWNAFAYGHIALISTNCIHWTWRWIAWIFWSFYWSFAFNNDNTLSECIASCSWRARTYRNVIWYTADGFSAAHSNAWILAFVSNTCFAHWTIRISSTFWSTSFIWITMIIANTFTNGVSIFSATACIITAWWWETNIIRHFWRS